MKTLNYILILLVLVAFVACKGNPKKKAIGTWQIESMEGETLSDAEKSMTMTFKEDGSLEFKMGDKSQSGKWSISADGKTITTIMDDKEEKMENVAFEGKKLSFTDKDKKIVLVKK